MNLDPLIVVFNRGDMFFFVNFDSATHIKTFRHTKKNVHIRQLPVHLGTYGSWIYNYLCNQCLSSLQLWVQIPLKERCIRC